MLIALRDRISEVAHFMPHIEEMAVLTREEQPGLVRMRNRWQGTKDNVPAALRPFVSRKLVGWHDEADWFADEGVCRWRIEPMIGARFMECRGTTQLVATVANCTDVTLTVDIELDPSKIPGVPTLIGRGLKRPIERFIANSLKPNLERLSEAVQAMLDEGAER